MNHTVWFIRYDTAVYRSTELVVTEDLGGISRSHFERFTDLRQIFFVYQIFLISLVRLLTSKKSREFSFRLGRQRSIIHGHNYLTARIHKNFFEFLKTFLKIVIIIDTDKTIGAMSHCLWRHRSCGDHPAVSSFAFQVRTN